jgi:hypothetical protein
MFGNGTIILVPKEVEQDIGIIVLGLNGPILTCQIMKNTLLVHRGISPPPIVLADIMVALPMGIQRHVVGIGGMARTQGVSH